MQDRVGNLVIRKPAHAGRETAPMTILQGHLDMVCEKNEDTAHNFDTDPIQIRRDGDWLRAEGTTLGADNGVGVCAALAVMESKDIAHGPLEFVFTIDEESGLTGATQFPGGDARLWNASPQPQFFSGVHLPQAGAQHEVTSST